MKRKQEKIIVRVDDNGVSRILTQEEYDKVAHRESFLGWDVDQMI